MKLENISINKTQIFSMKPEIPIIFQMLDLNLILYFISYLFNIPFKLINNLH